MDALMAALVAAALAQVGDRTARLAAILADRYRRPALVIVMAAVALAIAGGLAATGGILLAPRMTPEAKQFFVAMALIVQGGGALFKSKSPERLESWKLGAALTSLVGMLILASGDGVQFIVLALAARSTMPWLAAVGSTLGSLVVIVPAVVMGEADRLKLPLRKARVMIAALFIVAGLIIGIGAIGLI